jgi:hypothetical protein
MSESKDPRELLARLTAKPQHFAQAPGGVTYLDQIDLAHVLGKIKHPYAKLYARVKYADQKVFADELAIGLRQEVCSKLQIGQWRIPRNKDGYPRKDFILDLCRLALFESIDPGICMHCGGWGSELNDNGKIDPCRMCKSSGRYKIMEIDRAISMQLTKQSWGTPWGPRYREIVTILDRWDELIGGAVHNRLKSA